MKNIILFGFLFMSFSAFADSPTSLKIKVYEFLVSTNQDCSSPVSIYKPETPVYNDFVSNPSIGSGTINDGTYPCVIMVMSDQIKVTGSTCTETTLDVCSSGSSILPDGTTTTCAGSTDNKVAVYMSTLSTNVSGPSQGSTFAPATSGNTALGAPLSGALVVSADASGTFVFDATNKVVASSGACTMNARPSFGFR